MRKKTDRPNPKTARLVLPYCYGGIIVLFFLLLLYAVKGFFPFGEQSAAIMDMCHGYIPMYYHLYDFLHGDKALFYDFLSGTGVNMVGIAAVNGLLSPLNLLLYLTSRDGLVDFLNLFLVIKLVLCAVSAQFFFRRRFPTLSVGLATCLSALYALSGYVFLYYMHIIWLDVLILLPLLFYFCEKMLCGGKIFPYAFCLALSLIASFYLGIMTLICLFFISGAYVFTLLEKQKRPSAVFKLGLGTAVGGLMPMFLLLPAFLQMRNSARYGLTADWREILSALPELNENTIWMFYGMGLAVLGTVLLLRAYKKHLKTAKFALLSLFLLFSPLVLEGSAALLHFGSYKDFPYRFGFVAIFLLLALAAKNFSADEKKKDEDKKQQGLLYLWVFLGVACTVVVVSAAFTSFGGRIGSFSSEQTSLLYSLSILFCSVLAFYLIRQLPNRRVADVITLVLCVGMLFPFAMQTVGSGSPIRYERREHDTEYIAPSLAIGKEVSADPTGLERVHNPDMSLNINYGFVMGKAALSNWTHQIPSSLQYASRALGYSITYTLLLDGGGTLLSDALLHMTETVSKEELPEELYQKTGEVGDYSLYNNLYTLPVGMLCDDSLISCELTETFSGNSAAIFDNQNRIYHALGGSGNLVRTPENDKEMLTEKTETATEITYELQAKGQEALYLTAPALSWNQVEILVNGKTISVPSYHREDNTGYTSEYNNNCLLLGVFEDESVTVTLRVLGKINSEPALGFLSTEKMQDLISLHQQDGTRVLAEGRQITVSYQNDGDDTRYLFLPVSFDRGWSAQINGSQVEITPVFGSWMAVSVPPGSGEIELHFVPQGTFAGWLLSAAGTIVFLVLLLWEWIKKKQIVLPPLEKAIYGVFCILYFAAVAGVYLLPAGFSIVALFTTP